MEQQKEVKIANQRGGTCEPLLRILALVLTLTASIVLGVSKQTEIVTMKVIPTLPPIDIPATAKWHYLSAFVYLVVADVIACAYAAFSLGLLFANRGKKNRLGLVIIMLDLTMVALLFSAIGSTGAIGLMGYQGNTHVQWNKVCNVFGKFCHQVVASATLSLLGSLAFFFLIVLAVLGLSRTSN
ncbi:CASP-like protein 1E2 [Pyrus x bretschneideri]|uniref:CASP-like protein 1E2 n=1 Tax=Pyrus x bretschneideri TaxID=225117 RepID=UPI00051100BB|nr:CASP-like protein 1E2 [Pyrus x bretschneideri]